MKTNPAALSWTVRQPSSRNDRFVWYCAAVVCLICSTLAAPAKAQDAPVPHLQIFGGYAYTRFDTSTLGFASGSNLNGWNVSAAWNLTRNFGGVAELTGQYGNHANLRDFAAGPQFLYPRGRTTFFAHLLFGKGRTFISQGYGAGDTQNAFLFGGGMDMTFRRHLDIRVFQADYIHTELLQQDQNNVRLSTGIVYRWGDVRRHKHRAPTSQAP